MLSFEELSFQYEPYPIGVCVPAFATERYRALVESFPPLELFGAKEDLGHKYSLSEVNHPEAYHEFVGGNPPWLEFYRYVKSESFVRETIAALSGRGVDLGLDRSRVCSRSGLDGWSGAGIPVALQRLLTKRALLGSRFEFSVLPGDGGHILPHTDSPQKLITLVISMVDGDWRESWGGGTEVLRAKDQAVAFNKMNRYLGFDEVERIRVLPFRPNQCVIFVKTFNSLHAVSPVEGGDEVLRRTLTINIERLDTQP